MKIKNICCIGAGYVGGPTMAVISLMCPEINVTVVDLDKEKINAWNDPDTSNIPVKESGLTEIIEKVRNKNLFFSTDIDNAILESEMIFIAVNTPTKTTGEGKGMAADLKYVISSAINIARVAKTDKIVVEKSTLPVRTAEKLKEVLLENARGNIKFDIISNPEFLAEGTAINDLFKSDRVLIGGEDSIRGKNAVDALVKIYEKWIPKKKIITTNIWSSELSKLASNAMLAQRISSVNSLSALCEATGADIDEVSKVIGLDKRIGPSFLKASVGFGGSCFQKDILNLVYLCRKYKLNDVADYWEQVIKINDYQKSRFSQKLLELANDKNITILGWAFKKDTNDSRESAAIYVAEILINNNMNIHVYDPMVTDERILLDLKLLFQHKKFSDAEIQKKLSMLKIHKNHKDALLSSNLIGIVTEWDEFINYNWEEIAKKNVLTVIDGRNILSERLDQVKNIKYFKL